MLLNSVWFNSFEPLGNILKKTKAAWAGAWHQSRLVQRNWTSLNHRFPNHGKIKCKLLISLGWIEPFGNVLWQMEPAWVEAWHEPRVVQPNWTSSNHQYPKQAISLCDCKWVRSGSTLSNLLETYCNRWNHPGLELYDDYNRLVNAWVRYPSYSRSVWRLPQTVMSCHEKIGPPLFGSRGSVFINK